MSTAAQRTRRRQAPEQTRRQILDAAAEFLREHTFRELTVDGVMSRTGHTRTVFYRHFDDLPALVLGLMQDVGEELFVLGRSWAETEHVGPDEAHARLAQFVDFYVRHGPLVHAVSEAAHHDDTVEAAWSAAIEQFVALTTRAMETRIAAGEIDEFDAPEVARALVRMLNSYLDDRLGRPPFADRDRVLGAVWTIWTRTLFPG